MSDLTLKSILKTNGRYLSLLEQNGIRTPKDFLLYFPRTYEDRQNIKLLRDLVCDGKTTQSTKGHIMEKTVQPRGNKKLYDITFQDEEGRQGSITYFNSYFQFKNIEQGRRYVITGKPRRVGKKIIFSHPECTLSEEGSNPSPTLPLFPIESGLLPVAGQGAQDEDDSRDGYMRPIDKETDDMNSGAPGEGGWGFETTLLHIRGRIYPIYPELYGIKPAWFAKNMRKLIPHIPSYFHEYLPADFIDAFALFPVQETIKNMHFPESEAHNTQARQRIFFDRLLRIQLYALLYKQEYTLQHVPHITERCDRDVIKDITQKLPFSLTNAQKKVIKEGIEDIVMKPAPMMRLLQGDVGSGKTIVAIILAYYCIKKCDGQIAFLAPLTVLAHQHFASIAKLLLPLGIRVEVLSGVLSAKEKEHTKKKLADGIINIIIGTHALLQEDVQFKNLQLVVIDEQHKFGVRQRSFLKKFGNPHILQMSATPIPRSLALAFFGEFDVSIIDEMPAGRKAIHTKIVTQKEWIKLKPRVLTKVSQGQKVFVVTPLIEESEKMDEVASATESFHEMIALFPEIRGKIGLVHGKIKPKEKDAIMHAFKNGNLMMLVATTVIEVGIDIPEATLMIIKNAERFGLSQLHQLRGRIGRNDLQSYCFLETKVRSGDTIKRLKAMEETTDGFKLAEIDLQYRGTGEILGTRQSGESDIPLEILADLTFMQRIQQAAKRLLDHYPNLEGVPNLKKFMEEKMEDTIA